MDDSSLTPSPLPPLVINLLELLHLNVAPWAEGMSLATEIEDL